MESLGKCPYSPSLTSSTGFHKNGESWLNFSVVFCTCLLIHPLILWGGVANLVEKKLGHLVFANGWSHCQRSLTTPPPTVVAGSTLNHGSLFPLSRRGGDFTSLFWLLSPVVSWELRWASDWLVMQTEGLSEDPLLATGLPGLYLEIKQRVSFCVLQCHLLDNLNFCFIRSLINLIFWFPFGYQSINLSQTKET